VPDGALTRRDAVQCALGVTRRLAWNQLEQRVALSLGDVVLQAFVDPEPIAVEDGRRRPDGRAEKEPEQTPASEVGEGVVHEPAGFGWRKLGCVHGQRPAASTDDRLARGSEVPNPTDLAERRLDKPPVAELPHSDRRRARSAAHAATHGQEDVWTGGQAAAQDETHKRSDPAKQWAGDSLPGVCL
jgi:hypothetical protein